MKIDEGTFDDTYIQSGVVDDWPMALDRMNMAMGQYLQKQSEPIKIPARVNPTTGLYIVEEKGEGN